VGRGREGVRQLSPVACNTLLHSASVQRGSGGPATVLAAVAVATGTKRPLSLLQVILLWVFCASLG
jgi:hypothetical protein